MISSDDEIYETMIKVGFPLVLGTTMTAITLRESRGDARAFNGDINTGDRSYGWLQINEFYLGEKGLALFNIKSEEELYDPITNAKAGFILWGRNNDNLETAWYINKMDEVKDKDGKVVKNLDGTPKLVPSNYKLDYESFLPRAQAAALRFYQKSFPIRSIT